MCCYELRPAGYFTLHTILSSVYDHKHLFAVTWFMDRLRLYIPGMAPAPQDAGSVPLKELFCSSIYDSDDMFDQLAGSVPARSLCQELLHGMQPITDLHLSA